MTQTPPAEPDGPGPDGDEAVSPPSHPDSAAADSAAADSAVADPASAGAMTPDSGPRLPDRPVLPATPRPEVRGEQPDHAIPPLQATSPVDFVSPVADPIAAPPVSYANSMAEMSGMTGTISETPGFAPLRSDSPPSLLPTWWLRSALLVALLGSIVLTAVTEYQGEPGDIGSSTLVIGVHIVAWTLLLGWSYLAMSNAGRLVPPSRYQRRSSGIVAVVLWLVATVAPVATWAAYRRLEDRLADPDDLGAVFVMIAVVLVAFVCLWLPFRYIGRQASRVGAPHGVIQGWFYGSMIAAVGGVLAVAVGLRSFLAEDGFDRSERLVQLAAAYGAPMLVFTLATWRAVTVFDEVIDLRWRRWRSEWEQTLDAMAGQPEPGPEGSPDLDDPTNRPA